jgi:hypothetical protein
MATAAVCYPTSYKSYIISVGKELVSHIRKKCIICRMYAKRMQYRWKKGEM